MVDLLLLNFANQLDSCNFPLWRDSCLRPAEVEQVHRAAESDGQLIWSMGEGVDKDFERLIAIWASSGANSSQSSSTSGVFAAGNQSGRSKFRGPAW